MAGRNCLSTLDTNDFYVQSERNDAAGPFGRRLKER